MAYKQDMGLEIYKKIVNEITPYISTSKDSNRDLINDIRLYNTGSIVDFVKTNFAYLYSLSEDFLNQVFLSFWEGELDEELESILFKLKGKAPNLTIWLRVDSTVGFNKSEDLYTKLFIIYENNKDELKKLVEKSIQLNKIHIKSYELSTLLKAEIRYNIKKRQARHIINAAGLDVMRDCDINYLPNSQSTKNMSIGYDIFGDLYWCLLKQQRANYDLKYIIAHQEEEFKKHFEKCSQFCDELKYKNQYSDYYVFICEKR